MSGKLLQRKKYLSPSVNEAGENKIAKKVTSFIYRIETISDGSSTAIDVNFKELTNDTIFHEFFEKDV